MPKWKALIIMIGGIGLIVSGVLGCHSSRRTAEHYYQEGLKLKEEREWLQAVGAFRLALSENPQHHSTHLELGILLFRNSNYAQAIKHFLQAAQYGAPSYKTSAFIGYAYEQLGRPHTAERFYKKALAASPGLLDVRLRLANLLELQNKRLEAAAILRGILNIDPGFHEADRLRTRIDLLEQPEHPDVHLTLADLYIRHGDIERGVAEYRRASPFDSNDPDALVDLGLFCLERDQFEVALSCFREARRLGSTERFNVRAGLGIVYERTGQWEDAIQEFQAALALRPNWYEIHLKLARLYERIGRPDEAANEFEKIFRLSQNAAHLQRRMEFPDATRLWSEILRLRGEHTRKTIVQLQQAGQQYVIDARLNDHIPAVVIIDKQADYTIISEHVAQQLGLQVNAQTSEFWFQFRGESYAAPLVNLSSVKVGGVEVRNVAALIWNLSGYPGVDGVLGNSFLKHFEMEINYADQLFVLTKLYS